MATRAYLSACLCFKDAATYLPEWLAFYRALGVEHFYLYNNESTDNFAPVIAPYVNRGTATVIDFPGRGAQQAIYQHCLANFGGRTRWMMFCDDDEFLFPVADTSLPEALAPFECYAGVAVSWMLYGSSGHETRPDGLVIDNYRRRSAAPDAHVKCIVAPERIAEPVLIGHQFRCRDGHVVVNESGMPMEGPFSPRPSAEKLRINHYLTKSRAELVERRRRVQANTGELSPLSIERWFELESGWNQVEDVIASRYRARVESAIAEAGG